MACTLDERPVWYWGGLLVWHVLIQGVKGRSAPLLWLQHSPSDETACVMEPVAGQLSHPVVLLTFIHLHVAARLLGL